MRNQLADRRGWRAQTRHNERPHSDEGVEARIVELRNQGHSYPQLAAILNEQKWIQRKGRGFTATGVGKLLRGAEQTKHLTPKQYLESMLRRMEQEHNKLPFDEPFRRPSSGAVAENPAPSRLW